MSLDAIRRESYTPARPHTESGDLGPLDWSFSQSNPNTPPDDLGLEETLHTFQHEEQHVQGRTREIEELLKQQKQVKAEAAESVKRTEERLHEICAELQKHNRADILKSCDALRTAEVNFESQRGMYQYLEIQLETLRRYGQTITLGRETLANILPTHSSQDLPIGWLPSTSLAPSSADPLPGEQMPPATEPEDARHELAAILGAREYERQHLARGIAERIVPPLTNLILGVQQCQKMIAYDPQRAATHLGAVDAQLHGVLSDVLMLKLELEPLEMAELGLAGTLQRYVDYLSATRGIAIATAISGAEQRYPESLERAVFRIARAALENALRHSHAQAIRVELHARSHQLLLKVEDDGDGFVVDPILTTSENDPRHGIGQMLLERELIGGALGIESGPGHGTSIDYIIDLERPPTAH